ncbi:MAG TPA: hypothetical protein VKD91_20505 [Pyrinomonadaceae bacterium]|nr:hypothetical protein [Pyrinomonadaceae bacterium]
MFQRVIHLGSANVKTGIFLVVLALTWPVAVGAQKAQPTAADDSNARPPVTQADLQIVRRAREILDSPSKWNRADNRECPAGARTFSLYCALQTATIELSGKAEHRGAALQEARFVIDEIAADRNYEHRLMGYNNDPTTTFADIQEVFRITESLIALRLKGGNSSKVQPAATPADSVARPAVTKADIAIAKRARQILDSPAKWNRQDTQDCPADAKTFGLYCALAKATTEITGASDDQGAAFREARRVIVETAPNARNYQARLIDFNHDPTVTLADVQKLLRLVEERLTKQLTEKPVNK